MQKMFLHWHIHSRIKFLTVGNDHSQPNWHRLILEQVFIFFFSSISSVQFFGLSKYFHLITRTKQKNLPNIFLKWTSVHALWHLWISEANSCSILIEEFRVEQVWTAVFCSVCVLNPCALQWNAILQGHGRSRWLLEVITSVQEKITYTRSFFHWKLGRNRRKNILRHFYHNLGSFYK